MRLENDNDYNTLEPNDDNVASNAGEKDGLSAAISTFSSQFFWTNVISGNGPGFDSVIWNFTDLVSRGYPALWGVGEQ